MQQPPVAPQGYEVLRELGRGGMGIVYEARQVRLDRRVALKVMIAGREGSPELLHRFVQEARSAARLQHPNIVEVLEAGVEGSLHYFTMDIVDGAPVSSLVRPDPLPPVRAATLAKKVALALDYAHAQGVLHRDVKPSNILVDAGGEPHLVDFGLAKILQVPGTTVQGIGLGTPAYASPEQLNGELERVGPRSDVYSVGASLFEMLTGRPPFQGENDFEVFVSVLRNPPDSPRRIVPSVPVDLETICLKCMEKEPERRYSTALALAEDLGRFLAGEPITARPVSSIGRFATRLRRRPSVAIAAVAAFLTIASLGAWVVWKRGDDLRRLDRGLEQASAAERRAASASESGARLAAWSEARDALLGALEAVPDHAGARTALTRAEGEIAAILRARQEEADRAKREATAAEEIVRKSQLVSAVLSRWAKLQDAVLAIERATHSFKLTDEEINAEVDRQWPSVLAFVRETPADPTSQAAMRAFYGWALFLDQRNEEALVEVRAAQGLDPDVPYGFFVEAMFISDDYLLTASMSRLRAGVPAPGTPRAPSSPEVKAFEEQVRALLDRGAEARVWGPEGAEDFRAAFEGIDTAVCGDTTAAEEPLSRAIESPDLATFRIRFLFLRALARGQREEFDGAMRDLDEVEAAWPGDETVEGVRAALRTLRAARMGKGGKLDPGDVKELGEMLELVQEAPELAENSEMRGHMAILQAALASEQGKDSRAQFREGIAALTKALEASPGSTMARLSRATGWLALGKLEERLGGAPAEAFQAAVVDFDQVVAATPKFFAARQGRAAAREATGDLKGAIEDYREIARIEPKNTMAWDRIVALSRSLGDEATAQEGLRTLLEGCGAYLTKKEIEGSIAECEKALRSDPRDAAAYHTRGLAKHAAKDLDGAIADYGEAIRRNPRLAEAWANLGRARRDKGDIEAARSYFTSCLELATADWPYRKTVETWLSELGAGR